jgi:hypothetical protein
MSLQARLIVSIQKSSFGKPELTCSRLIELFESFEKQPVAARVKAIGSKEIPSTMRLRG